MSKVTQKLCKRKKDFFDFLKTFLSAHKSLENHQKCEFDNFLHR